jgi:hypothetical protein
MAPPPGVGWCPDGASLIPPPEDDRQGVFYAERSPAQQASTPRPTTPQNIHGHPCPFTPSLSLPLPWLQACPKDETGTGAFMSHLYIR